MVGFLVFQDPLCQFLGIALENFRPVFYIVIDIDGDVEVALIAVVEAEPLAELQVRQPTLFLLGEHDPVGRFEAPTLARMAAKVPLLEQHLLPGCGHWLQSEDGTQVNTLLLDFLGRHYPAV